MNVISSVKQRAIFFILLESLALWLGIAAISFAITPISTVLAGIIFILSPLPSIYYFVKKGLYFLNDRNIARLIEKAYPEFENRLSAVFDLDEGNYSEFLVEKLLEETNELLAKVNPGKVYHPDTRLFRFSLYSLAGFLILFNVFADKYTRSILDLVGAGIRDQKYAVIKPARVTAFSDSTVTLKLLPVNFKAESTKIMVYGDSSKMVLTPDTILSGMLIYRLRALRPGIYHARSIDGFISNAVFLKIVEKPFIDSVVVKAKMPSYLGSSVYTVKNPRYLAYLGGTRLELLVYSITSDSVRWGSKILKRQNSAYHLNLTVRDTLNLRFTLFHSELSTYSPYEISVIPINDNPPGVEILFPQGTVNLPEDMKVPLIVRSYDDFGLKSLGLVIKYANHVSDTIIKRFKGEFEDTTALKVSLENLSMMPGDEAYIYAVATDLKNQSDTSDALIVRFPTLEEMYQQSQAVSDTGITTIKDIKKHTEKIMEKINQLETLLKSERKVDWSKKQSLKELVENEKKFLEQVKKSFERINKSLEQLQQQINMDPELIKKIQEIQKLFQESMTDELRKMLENLNKLMQKKVTPEQLAKALENLKLNQEVLKRNLERMENILKKFAEEQKLKEFAERMRELENEEEILKSRIEAGDTSSAILSKQKEITKKIENLKREISEFSKNVSDKKLQKSLENLANVDFKSLEQMSTQSASSIEKGDKEGALKRMEKTAQKMEDVAQKLENMRKNLVNRRKKELVEKIRKVRQGLIFSSSLQVKVNKSVPELKRNVKTSYFNLAQDEEAALSATQQSFKGMLEIFKNTMALSPKALGLTYGAMETMKGIKTSFELFRTPSPSELSKALAYVNLAILELYGAEKNLQQGKGSSTYLEEAMKKLSEAARKQASLNQQGKSMMSMPNPAMSQLLSMAAQQAAIQQLVNQAMKLSQGSQNLARMLQEISKEMSEVEKALKQGKYNEKIYRKQKRLLVRLLEAQRSIHKQEFARRRESKTGKSYKTTSPGEVKEEVLRKRIKTLLFDIDRDKSIPEDYKVLIKAYLKSLLEE